MFTVSIMTSIARMASNYGRYRQAVSIVTIKGKSMKVTNALRLALAIASIFVLSQSAHAEKVFEVNPASPPLYISDKAKHYPCSPDLINGGYLDMFFEMLTGVSKNLDLMPPQKGLCEYVIADMDLGGGKSTSIYYVAFYVDRDSYELCKNSDKCLNTRWVMFRVVNNALAFQYTLSNDDNSKTYNLCSFKNKKGKYTVKEEHC